MEIWMIIMRIKLAMGSTFLHRINLWYKTKAHFKHQVQIIVLEHIHRKTKICTNILHKLIIMTPGQDKKEYNKVIMRTKFKVIMLKSLQLHQVTSTVLSTKTKVEATLTDQVLSKADTSKKPNTIASVV